MQEDMSTMENEVLVLSTRHIKNEPRTVNDIQDILSTNAMLKTGSSVFFDSHETNFSQTGSIQLENSSCQGNCKIKIKSAAHIQQKNWKLIVKLSSQDSICSTKTEQDHMDAEKTEWPHTLEEREKKHGFIVKTETDWPGKHVFKQHGKKCQASSKHMGASKLMAGRIMEHQVVHDASQEVEWSYVKTENILSCSSSPKVQEMNAAGCNTPKIMDIVTESCHHQTHHGVSKINNTIGSENQHNDSHIQSSQYGLCTSFKYPSLLKECTMTQNAARAHQCGDNF